MSVHEKWKLVISGFIFGLELFSNMSYAHQSQILNITTEQQYAGLLERVFISTLIGMPCCMFLFINSTMLFTLRSKAVLCETSRYILLYNLLFADTALLVLSQIMYILGFCRVILTYPVCGLLTMLTSLTNAVSPLTLVLMCLERYVAVCYPLRHATIITIRNTGVAIIGVWSFSSLNVLIRVLLLLNFPFSALESLQMSDVCSDNSMFIDPVSHVYDKAYKYFLFVSAGLSVSCSYIGVMIAARSASTDRASARKARNTLLLHVVQLGLSLLSTLNNPMFIIISKILTRIERVRIKIFFYVCVYLLPRCLSALIYGIRDQTIRPVLMYHLCCRVKIGNTATVIVRVR